MLDILALLKSPRLLSAVAWMPTPAGPKAILKGYPQPSPHVLPSAEGQSRSYSHFIPSHLDKECRVHYRASSQSSIRPRSNHGLLLHTDPDSQSRVATLGLRAGLPEAGLQICWVYVALGGKSGLHVGRQRLSAEAPCGRISGLLILLLLDLIRLVLLFFFCLLYWFFFKMFSYLVRNFRFFFRYCRV